MSSPASSPRDDGSGRSVAGGALSALGCQNCWSADTGFISRVIIVVGLTGILLGAAGIGMYTMLCPSLFFSSPLNLYRFFTSPLIPSSLFSALLALVYLWMMARTIEPSRGSMWFAFTTLQLTYLTNMVSLTLSALFGLAAGSDFFLSSSFCVSGLWPAAMGLMVLECLEHPEEERSFCCIPGIKMKYHPLIMLAIMFILSLPQVRTGWLIGTGLGYLMHYYPTFQLSVSTASRWEMSDKMRWLTQRDAFRFSVVQGLGGGHWAHAPAHPASRFATVHGGANNSNVVGAAGVSSAQPQQQQPAVFSGQGHRLGSADRAMSPSALQQSQQSSSSASPAPASEQGMSSPRTAGNDPSAAVAEARRQRAAAIDKRMGKAGASVKSPLSVPGIGNSTAPSAASLDRPPSPSGIRSALNSDPATSMFTLGLDEDAAAEEREIEEMERGNAAASAAASRLDETQGYEMSTTRKGKKGYAAVDAMADGPEDEEQTDHNAAASASSSSSSALSSLRSSPPHHHQPQQTQQHTDDFSADLDDDDDPLAHASELSTMQIDR